MKVTEPMMVECREIIDELIKNTGIHVHPNQPNSISWLLKRGEESIMEIYGRSSGTRQDTPTNKGPKYRISIRDDVSCPEYQAYLTLPEECKLYPLGNQAPWHGMAFCWYVPKNRLRFVLSRLLGGSK